MLSDLWSSTLSSLQALAVAHQSAHWRSSGESFYSDHLMYQRMYEAIANEIDQVGERLLGHTADDAQLEPSRRLVGASLALKSIFSAGDTASAMLMAEKAFLKQLCATVCALETMGQLTAGVEDLLQSIASKHEEHIYLLSRRAGAEVLRVCVGEAISNMPNRKTDIRAIKEHISESRKRRKKKAKSKAWYAGGPISTGPGNPGFNSSAGPGAS